MKGAIKLHTYNINCFPTTILSENKRTFDLLRDCSHDTILPHDSDLIPGFIHEEGNQVQTKQKEFYPMTLLMLMYWRREWVGLNGSTNTLLADLLLSCSSLALNVLFFFSLWLWYWIYFVLDFRERTPSVLFSFSICPAVKFIKLACKRSITFWEETSREECTERVRREMRRSCSQRVLDKCRQRKNTSCFEAESQGEWSRK